MGESEDLDAEGVAALGLIGTAYEAIRDNPGDPDTAALLETCIPLLDSLPEGGRYDDIRRTLRAASASAVRDLVNPPPTAAELLVDFETALATDRPRTEIQDLRQMIKREGGPDCPELHRQRAPQRPEPPARDPLVRPPSGAVVPI